MGKIWKALCAIGGGLSIGAVAYAAALGYDVTNTQIWVIGVRTFFETPSSIVAQALGEGPDAGVFQAITMLSLGLLGMVLGLVLWSVSALRPSFKFRRRKDSTASMRIDDRKPLPQSQQAAQSDDTFVDKKVDARDPTASVTSRIKAALQERAKRDAFDAEIESTEKTKWAEKLKGLFAKKPGSGDEPFAPEERPENKAAQAMMDEPRLGAEKAQHDTQPEMFLQQRGTKKKTARLKMKEKSANGATASNMAETISGWIGAVGEWLSARRGKVDKPYISEHVGASRAKEAASQKALHDDIKEWFAAVQSGASPQHELVQKAAEFARILDAKERDAFTEIHSIDGAFILRLIDSWSTRTDVSLEADEAPESRNDERQALRAAIRAVHMEKAGLSTIDDEALPAEFTRSLDADVSPSWEPEDSGVDGIQDDLRHSEPTPETDESSEDASGKARMQAAVIALSEEMWSFHATIKRCLLGETEWPDTLLYEEDREEEIERLYEKWASVSFAMDEEDFERIASEEGSETMDWLVRETSILTLGFKGFMREETERFIAQARGEDPVPTWSDEDIADTPTQQEPIDIPFEDEEEEAQARDEDSSGESDATTVLDQGRPRVQETPGVEEAPAGASADLDENQAIQSQQDEESIVEQPEEEQDVIPTTDVEIPEDEGALNQGGDTPAPHVPSSVGLTDEEEIAAAEDAVTAWGKVLQDCGASTGAIMKFTFQRSGVSVRPLGHIHVAAIWKGREGIGRVNVLFKTLPEGVWQADPAVPGRFTNEAGDWVEVRPSLFESTDFAGALLMVHLRGVGVFDEGAALPSTWGKAIRVVKDIPEKDAIVAMMNAAS